MSSTGEHGMSCSANSSGPTKHPKAFCPSRRRFLTGTGVGLSLGLGGVHAARSSADTSEADFEIYDEATRFEMEDKGDEILNRAYELGYRMHQRHGGCARCTVAALQEAVDFVPDHPGLFRAATCLDAGAAPGTKLSCGCFTGAGIVIGYICGGENFASRALAHRLIQQVARKFQDAYGTVLCEDALEQGNCHEVVGLTAKWTAEALLDQFTDHEPS